MRIVYICVVLVFFISSCYTNEEKIILRVKKELSNVTPKDFKTIFKEENIFTPYGIRFSNPNYYYIFAKLCYNTYGYDIWSSYLLDRASNTQNIFRKESLNFYIESLITSDNFGLLKKVIKKNNNFIDSNYKDFLNDFVDNKDLSEIENIPPKKEFFILINKIAKRKKDVVKEKENIEKIVDFILKTGKEIEFYKKNREKLRELVEITNFNPFINLYYCYVISDYPSFKKNLFAGLRYVENEKELEFVKNICYKMSERKEFYKSLEMLYKYKQPFFSYYYASELEHFLGNGKTISFYQSILPKLSENSDINYQIRAKLLYAKYNFNETWIKDVVDFVNDYPKSYHSKALLNWMLRSALYQKKTLVATPYLKQIAVEKMDVLEQGIFYYLFYLVDSKNDEWKQILIKTNPLSYGALSLTDGKIDVQYKFPILNKDFSLEGQAEIDKVKYLLEFNLFDEAKNIKIEGLQKNEQIEILNLIYNQYLLEDDYYNAVKIAGEYASLLYGENLVGIDIATLQMLFPLHYKDFFIKYSAEYNIDPSLSYAVMREESRYNKNIVSFANAVGLMQIMPSTAKFISGKTGIKNYDLTNPEDNIRMGTYYLQFLTRYFTESELILSCYNAGPGRTIRWHNIYRNYPNKIMYELIPIEETRHYIRKVTRSYYIYKFLIKNEENINKTIASLKK